MYRVVPWFSRAVAVLFLTAVALCVTTVVAIHEDEQGLRDWIIHLVGDVHDAAVQVSANPQLLYMASRDGAVAAVDVSAYGGLNLTWRMTSSATPLCVASSFQVVLTVNNAGVAMLLDPATGSIEVTYPLQTVVTTLQEASCAIEGTTAVVVTYDGAQLKRFEFSIDSEEPSIPVATQVGWSGDVTSLLMGGNVLLVGRRSGASDVLNLKTLAKERQVAGIATSVAADGHFATHDSTTLRSISLQGSTVEIPCESCGAAVIAGANTGESAGLVRVATMREHLRITFPTSDLMIPNVDHSTRPAHPLLAFQRGNDDVMVLIQTGAHDLVLVSAREGVLWRRFEGLANVAASAIAEPMGLMDHFHFDKNILVASRFGTLYAIPIAKMGSEVDLVVDFSKELVTAMKASSIEEVSLCGLTVREEGRTAVVHAVKDALSAHVVIDLVERAIVDTSAAEHIILTTPLLELAADMTVKGEHPRGEVYTYVSNTTSGTLRGFRIGAEGKATLTWMLEMPSSIIAHAAGDEPGRTDVVNNLHVYPNISGKDPVEEVRHTYPMRNVIAVAHYEPSEEELPSLVVTAIDVVTGNILATARHPNVEGDVKMVIVEHLIVYHYLDAKKMRHCFGVWEVFEDEAGPVVSKSAGATIPQIIASFFVNTKRTFSSRASRPPVVAVSTLGTFGGPLADMSVTTSYSAVARKSLVLAYESGRVAVVELRQFMTGNQMPIPNEKGRLMTHIMLPSFLLATHKYRVAFPRSITTAPTGLESSCHVLVSGLDLFYVRSSSGKPFDLLNSDFNKPLLISLVGGFAALSIVVRYFVNRKVLNAAWQ